ncbi:MAG: hypothetical protein IPK83_06480 [Planctomycetes bacterium]|nr:hypothetical protein [Planctomycetota bacterium]
MRANGKYVIAWADAEEPDNSFSAFNIRIQGYEIDGTTIGSEIVVNDISSEVDDSSQDSPAVTIDESGNIVVAWVGTRLDGCENGPLFQIFGRRLSWDGTTTPSFVDTPFRVDSDDDAPPTNAVVANPAVALTSSTDEGLCGRFIVAWNVAIEEESPTRHEIHAQYFGPDGRPIAGEFRVNQDTSDTDAEVLNMRQLADGGQHTIDYGPDGQVVVVWTAYELVSSAVTPLDVYYTLLPSGFEEQLAESANCLKGDINTDGFADGADIQPFVDFLLGNSHCFSIVNLCGADCNCDGQLTLDDVPPFVDVLLGEPGCTGFIGCDESTHGSPPDCDENDVPDATQIMLLCDPIEAPENCDCNENGVPDGCDIADETSSDIDEDGRPDECQTDCNENSIPDSYEIEESMVDDCNGNSIPDECEIDCNENDVSDDCDVDPLDPDGDTEVSADCNGNGSPDECEYDCDENGVPDDCDLDPLDPDGDEWVDPDCNENGWPDSCDIDEGPPFGSLDANENEIPDECEEEEMMMGGGEGGGESMMSGGGSCDASYWPADYSVLSNEMYAAWEAFMMWCMQERWGPDSAYTSAGAVGAADWEEV